MNERFVQNDAEQVEARRNPPAEYPMANNPRGRALIFNHKTFNTNLKLSIREGTEEDRNRLRAVFQSLGFIINDDDVCDDFTFKEIQQKLLEVSREDHTDFDCLVVAVMTHGTESKIGEDKLSKLYAFDQDYFDSELWKPFLGRTCRTLRSKPKLFFIQACRGGQREKPVYIYAGKAQKESMDRNNEDYLIENKSHILIARAASRGAVCYRTPTGSLFFQSLCEELEADLAKTNDKKEEINDILTTVGQKVANKEIELIDEETYDEIITKQMPWIQSNLTKELYFRDLNRVEN